MTLRKQLAALLAAGALGLAAMGTVLAAGNNGDCDDSVNRVVAAGVGECEDESGAPEQSEAVESDVVESDEPTFEESEAVETDVVESDEPTFEESEAVETDAPSEPVITEAPSFEQSEEVVTDPPVTDPPVTDPPVTDPPVTDPPPSFFQSEEGETDAPSEPDTATIGESDATGSPADGAWLLVVALGMLLASIVVLTPVRVKNRR